MSFMNKSVFAKALVAALFAIIFSSSIATGQEVKPRWIISLETAIKEQEKEWKIDDVTYQGNSDSFTGSIILKRGDVRGAVEIHSYEILTNPEETFQGQNIATSNIIGKRMTKKKLDGYGDEAFLWTPTNPNGHAQLHARKGKTFVSVFIPNVATAQRFARLALSLIPDSK